MHRNPPHRYRAADSDECSRTLRGFAPSIDAHDVFRELIVEELRNGRLTPARRRRIVRYAARFGLSAVQVGRMIAACRDEALRSANTSERRHALRLVEPVPAKVPVALKIALVVAGATLLDVLVIRWLW